MTYDELADYCKKASNEIIRQDEEIRKLEKENQELEKQLENYKKLGFKHLQDKNNNSETQQKEFINYLEGYLNLFDYDQISYDMIEEILQKYKEIIGDDK